jgi:hypothetical protein
MIRAVTNHGHRPAQPCLGGYRTEPAGAKHIGGSEEARHQVRVGNPGGGDQGALGQRHPQPLGLGAARGGRLAVDAGALVAGPADLAGVVGCEERPDYKLAWPDCGDRAADLLHDPGVLMPHRPGAVDGLDAPVGP